MNEYSKLCDRDVLKPFDGDYTHCPEEFPIKGLENLKNLGLLSASILDQKGKLLGDTENNILKLLQNVGSYDLSLGRIFEGHINALLLIDTFGSESQKEQYFDEAEDGYLFGVWNSELPEEAMTYDFNDDNILLRGAKIFCSGARHIHRPIITCKGESGKQMIILHHDHKMLIEDYTYWNPFGMIGSISCRFDFTTIYVDKSQRLGSHNDYDRQPDFTGGAIRFAAVQLGGAQAAIKTTIKHLKKQNRLDNSDQSRRISKMAILIERGNIWLKEGGLVAQNKKDNPDQYQHFANIIRTEIREICEEVLRLCELSIGLQGLMKPHTLERIHRDLHVYLKQPGPDNSLNAIGNFFKENFQ